MRFEKYVDKESTRDPEFYKDLIKELGIKENDIVYGQIKSSTQDKNYCFIDLYKVGKLFPDYITWGIYAKIPQGMELKQGDYVSGKLIFVEGEGTQVTGLTPLKDWIQFKEELCEVLKPKWEPQWFDFDKLDVAFNKGGLFAKDLEKKVDILFELKFEEKINELKNREKQIEKGEAKKKKLERKIEELEESKKRLTTDIEDYEKAKKKAESELNKYKRLGIIPKIKKTLPPEYQPKSFKELVDYVWLYLWEKEDLQYDKNIIRCFMSALRTKQLIVLEGEPGTGKTSMPQAIAHAIGGKCTLIQVQANWTDSQDLLGYFNPIDKRFYATKFLNAIVDAIKDANNNREIIHFIVLDEMNLAHVEYYFAEMLNYFTWNSDKQGPYRVNLYSENIYLQDENSGEAVDDEPQQNSGETGDKELLQNRYYYKAICEIPDNIRFIGTINSDETTKSLSPKVIDRSCIIELFGKNKDVKENDGKKIEELSKNMKNILAEEWYVNQEKFEVKQTDELDKIDGFAVLKKIEGELSAKGINTNNRLYTYMRQWFAGGEDCCAKIDDVIFTKLLPLVRYSDNISEGAFNFKSLKEKITEDYPLSMDKLDQIEKSLRNRESDSE